METEENVIVMPMSSWKLMPPADRRVCQECAIVHDPEMPHNAQSLFYGTKYMIDHDGEQGSWLTAMAHCTPEVQAEWTSRLEEMGVDVAGGKVNPG